jgi:hypothetical protein
MARIQSLAQQFVIAKRETLEATQRAIVEVARREHEKVLATDPKPGGHRQWVDGKEGAAFENVRADGVIFIVYDRLQAVVNFALETLRAVSPVDSGAYRGAHTLVVNGSVAADLSGLKSGDGEIYITNPLPYARKIELGKMTMRVPGTEKVYAQAEQVVQRRFGNVAAVKFTFITPPGAKGKDARRPALYIRSYAG